MNQEQYIDHEVRLRLHDAKFERLEKTVSDIKKIFYWFLGTTIVGVIIPILLHHYSLT